MIEIAMVKVQAHMTKLYGYDRNDDGIMLNKRIYDRIVEVSLYYDRIVGISLYYDRIVGGLSILFHLYKVLYAHV